MGMTGTSQHPTSGEQEVLMAARRLLSGMIRYGHVEVAKQPVLVAAILLALSNPGFTPAKLRQAGHTTGDNNADTGGGIVYQAARQHLENTGVPQGSISTIMGQFMFLKNDTRLSQVNPGLGESVLSWVCRFTREHLYEHATGERVPAVDVLGFLYRESAAAGGGDGVALGIVLTPPHITALMADLISIGSGEERVVEAARKAIYSPLLETTIDGAEDVIVNVTGGLDLTLIEAEEASEIVNQAAGQGVNIWLGTSIDESMKDEIRVTVVATGVRQDRVEKVVGSHAPYTTGRPSAKTPQSHTFDRQFDLEETAELPKSSPRRFETNQASAFGDWDLRRESIVRQTDSVVSPVERFETPVSQDEDELDTPPFFKNR